MRKCILFVLLVLVCCTGCTSLNRFRANPQTLVSKNFTDTIQVEFYNDNIIIPVNISSKTKRFLLDTGSITLIFDSLAQEIGCEGKQASTSVRSSDGKTRKYSMLQLKKIGVGKLDFENVWVACDDGHLEKLKPCLGLDGIIGFDVLATLNVKFEMKDRRLILTDNDTLFQADDIFKQAMTVKAPGYPFITMTFLDRDEEVLFDSGDTNIFGRKRKMNLVKDKKEGKIKEENIKQLHNSNGQLLFEEIHFQSIKINGVEVQNFKMIYPSKTFTTLGAAILNFADVVLNYRRNEFWLIPHNSTTQLTIPPSFGFRAGLIDRKCIVMEIEEGSLAHKAGLEKGFEITTINNQAIDAQTVCGFTNSLNYREAMCKDSITLLVVDNSGKEKGYILKR